MMSPIPTGIISFVTLYHSGDDSLSFSALCCLVSLKHDDIMV